MKILITGATGFVGMNLMPMLVKEVKGTQVLVLARNVEKAQTLFPYSECQFARADDWNAVKAFNPECALHLASLCTSRNDSDIVMPLIETNITFGVKLLDALRECSALRLFVNTGTFAEYRFGTETFNNAYLYSATKTAFRSFVDYYSQLGGYKYVNVIPYSIYGGIPTVKRLMDYILESMDSPEPVDMTAGEQILDFTHVDDLCRFYVHLVKHIDLMATIRNGESFHIGTGQGTTVRQLAQLMEEVYERKCNINWGGRPYRDHDTMHAVAPIAKNLALLGWRTEISLREGITRMMERY